MSASRCSCAVERVEEDLGRLEVGAPGPLLGRRSSQRAPVAARRASAMARAYIVERSTSGFTLAVEPPKEYRHGHPPPQPRRALRARRRPQRRLLPRRPRLRGRHRDAAARPRSCGPTASSNDHDLGLFQIGDAGRARPRPAARPSGCTTWPGRSRPCATSRRWPARLAEAGALVGVVGPQHHQVALRPRPGRPGVRDRLDRAGRPARRRRARRPRADPPAGPRAARSPATAPTPPAASASAASPSAEPVDWRYPAVTRRLALRTRRVRP